MGICKNCKFWDNSYGFSGDKSGSCERLGFNDNIISDALCFKYIKFHKDGNPQQVCTGENFGCVLFEQKPLLTEN